MGDLALVFRPFFFSTTETGNIVDAWVPKSEPKVATNAKKLLILGLTRKPTGGKKVRARGGAGRSGGKGVAALLIECLIIGNYKTIRGAGCKTAKSIGTD